MSENFAELFEESIAQTNMRVGEIITAEVVDINRDVVIVNAGLKSEGVIPIEQFLDENGELEVKIGDQVEVALEAIEDGYGETRLSREKAKRARAWARLEQALENDEILLHITDMAWKRVKHPSEVVEIGQEIDVVVLKFDREKNRVSLGLKQLGDDPWVNITRRYPEGSRLFGRVSNITDYGCFVEIEDGVEGLGGQPRRRGRGHDPRNRRGPSPHLAGHEAVHAESLG